MVRSFATTLALLFAAAATAAVPDTVSEEDLRARIAVLASDDYQGRQPGTEGGVKAEAYVRDAFAQAGLVPGAPGGGWDQEVALVRRAPVAGTLRLGAVTVAAGDLALTGAAARESLAGAPVWFVGAATPEQMGDADLRGAIVLVAASLPDGGHSLGARRRMLQARGVAAMLVIPADDAGWARYAAAHVDAQRPLRIDGAITRAAAGALVAGAGQGLDALVASAKQPGFAPVRLPGLATLTAETRITPFRTANIIGKVAGSDPAAGAVVLSAHWDHLGLCRPEGAPDRICNGADDNASGTAMLIEIARHIAAGPRPVRDVYFLATTAEEMGLLGAQAFAEHPPVPLGNIVAALNLDTAAIAPAGMAVAILGRGRTPTLDAAIDAVTVRAGRRVDSDNEADIMLKRQDGWALAEKGVPAVMVSGSFSDMSRLMAYLRGNYHGPLDDLAHLPPLDGAAEDATLHVALIRALADPVLYPSPAAKRP